MLTLALFVPAKRVIFDSPVRLVSIIDVLEAIDIRIPPGEEVPANAVSPESWQVYTWWRSTPEDIDRVYEQKLEFLLPDGEVRYLGTVPFTMVELTHKVRIDMTGIPVGQEGQLRLRLSLRLAETDEAWATMTEHIMDIRHIAVSPGEGTDSASDGQATAEVTAYPNPQQATGTE